MREQPVESVYVKPVWRRIIFLDKNKPWKLYGRVGIWLEKKIDFI